MTAYNVVRFKVKPGQEQAFIDFHKRAKPIRGLTEGSLIKTGDRSYCLVAKWDSFDSIVAARPTMISMLDDFRGMLEDQGNGVGVTDPVSGEVILNLAV
jgi:hypothetical protein